MSRSSTQADDCHRVICEAQLGFFRAILEVDTDESWWQDGARDTAHWLVMRYGFSSWKANRFVEAARALESLRWMSEALGSGVLGTDKVVELTRFATPDTEAELIPWAEIGTEGMRSAVRRSKTCATPRDPVLVQTVLEDAEGNAFKLGRMSRSRLRR